MSYLLRRIHPIGGYVAQPGSKSSYTFVISHARIFRTEEEAEAERCPENEIVVPLASVISTYQR